MTESFSIRCTDKGDGEIFEAFFKGYERAFTLPEEMEDREGFAACLALNHGPEHERLVGEFGLFRELCLILCDVKGDMVAGANFIALGSDSGTITVNLNYIYVLPGMRGRGYLRSAVQAVKRAAADAFGSPSAQVLLLIEQNDPLRMDVADQRRDTIHSGMGQYDRLAIWGRQGARVVDFPYVQPPLTAGHVPNAELVLSVIGTTEGALPAAILLGHLRGFFGISVAKGGPLDASATEQLDRLAAMAAADEPLRLIDPMPALALHRPAMGDWPDFRSFARHAESQAPISL